MQKYEYKLESLGYGDIEELLNKSGEEGWKIVWCVHESGADVFKVLLERPKVIKKKK